MILATAVEFSAQQVTAMVVAGAGLLGLRVIAPLFGLVNNSRAEIASLQKDNRDLHERIGGYVTEQRQMGEAIAELKIEMKLVKATNADLLTDKAKLEAENVTLRLKVITSDAAHAAEIAICKARILTLQDEVDEQLIFRDMPPKYEGRNDCQAVAAPAIDDPAPQRFTPSSQASPPPSPAGSST